MGGDFYRLRIFVDPIGAVASNGTGAGAVVKETGRFEVTKHIMWSRHILKPMPVLPDANTIRGVQARLSILGYDTGAIDGVNGGQTQVALTAFQGNNAPPLPVNGNVNDGPTQTALDNAYKAYLTNCGQALGNINFATIKAQFDQMHCAFNSTGARATPKLTEAEYKAAIRWARAQAQANQGALGLSQNYDINTMVEDNFQTPFWIVIRHPLFYNRTRAVGVPAAGPAAPAAPRTPYDTYYNDAGILMYGNGVALGLLEWLLRYFNGNASVKNPPTANVTRYSTPGLTVIRCLAQAVTMFNPGQPGQVQVPRVNAASGIAMKERGCYVFYGNTIYNNWPYQGDGLSKNTRHEMGHTLYLRHSKMPPPAGANHAGGDFHEDHDNNDCCVMSYFYNIGEYCAKCQLKIRGWDISKMPV
jgi:peptidoglycan hydrolase-like protein with peptidoglycan-binding domain